MTPNLMQRDVAIQKLTEKGKPDWDLIIIGGGATGLGAAVEASTRGIKTILLEQADFSKGTSSRSTKLVHGGVRYLAQGNISLVREALRERGRLKKNAPHLVRNMSFLIPVYNFWGRPFYTTGLVLYDLLAGKLSLGKSRPRTAKKTLEMVPGLIRKGLRGGVEYHDGQFDDSRLAINLMQTFVEAGGVALNYTKVTSLTRVDGKVNGVTATDLETGESYNIRAKAILNATGIFVDMIRHLDDPRARDLVRVSQGVHIVLDRKFLPGNHAIMIPKTSDGRVLFAVPWHRRVIVGTTDVPKKTAELEPSPLPQEIDFILETAGRYLALPPTRDDILSVFAGLRPLAAPKTEGKSTREISRGHIIKVSPSGLVSITGGKWTTYRQMGEDVIDLITKRFNLRSAKSVTAGYRIHGHSTALSPDDDFYYYGSDKNALMALKKESPVYGEFLSKKLSILKVQVIWSTRHEMARTPEDFLARRTRALFLDAEESRRIAPDVARLMASELGRDESWINNQLKDYMTTSRKYIVEQAIDS